MMDNSRRLTLNSSDRNTAMESSCWSKFSVRAADLISAPQGEQVLLMSRVGNLGSMLTGFNIAFHPDCTSLLRQIANDLDALDAGQSTDPRRI